MSNSPLGMFALLAGVPLAGAVGAMQGIRRYGLSGRVERFMRLLCKCSLALAGLLLLIGLAWQAVAMWSR